MLFRNIGITNLKRSFNVWALSDGLPGHQRQAHALASALCGTDWVAHTVSLGWPWSFIAPRVLPGANRAFGSFIADGQGVLPTLAVGCGRQAAFATRLLRRQGVRVVQILDPRMSTRHWDAVVVPAHDQRLASNLFTVLGSLNPIDDAWLARGRAAFPQWSLLPNPRVAVLLGGPTRHVPWTLADLQGLCVTLRAFVQRCAGSILVTPSRRTPNAYLQSMVPVLERVPHRVWTEDHGEPNPYQGILAWADLLIATSDSVNLLSEACATRVPVVAAFAHRAQGRVQRFVASLLDSGRVTRTLPHWPLEHAMPPLRETQRLAQTLRPLLFPDAD